jgi:protein-disulfide isomerase
VKGAAGVAAALLLIGLPAQAVWAKAPAKAQAARDWTHNVAATAEGGFRMGNPKARIAIVEYGSLTCPHCRHFAESAMKPLLGYVRSGKASYEFRPFVLNEVDLAATLVARCGGPSRFFPIAEQLYATQPEWSEKLGNLPADEQNKIGAMGEKQQTLAIAKVSGLIPIAAAHGIPAAKAQACLGDGGAALGLMKIRQAGEGLGVTGTPTIFVNGKKQPVYDWATLEPFLKGGAGG